MFGFAVISDANGLQINDLIVVAANTDTAIQDTVAMPSDDAMASDVPMGQQDAEEPSLLPEESEIGDVFGTEGGYFHPYLNIYGEYTDNLYNADEDEVDSFIYRVSPGVWFALPRKKVIPVSITPHNTSPGGLQNQLAESDYADRFMSYALIGADVKKYSEESELDDIDWAGEGLLRYNFRGGLSLQLVDRFTKSEDTFDYTTEEYPNQRSLFTSNILLATADWEMTEKLRLKVDYTNFLVDYDEDFDAWRNRTDNSLDVYGYFNISLKTSIFLQYKYLDVSYDEAEYNDSKQDFYFGGIKWDTTEKLSLLLKAGYQKRDFVLDTRADNDGFALDIQATYRYSQKTEGRFALHRTNEETDSITASDKDVWGATLNYRQKFNDKIEGTLDLTYEDATYTVISGAPERDETTFYVRPAIQYLFKEWMQADLSYSYEVVDSTIPEFEYETNTVMLGLNFAI